MYSKVQSEERLHILRLTNHNDKKPFWHTISQMHGTVLPEVFSHPANLPSLVVFAMVTVLEGKITLRSPSSYTHLHPHHILTGLWRYLSR